MRKGTSSTDSATRTLISPDGRNAGFPTNLRPTDDYVGPAKAEEVEFKCGHKGPMFYAFSVNGDTVVVTQRFAQEKTMCAVCMTKEIQTRPRCAVCGHRIEENDAVALYVDDGYFRPDATKVEFNDQHCVIGGACCAPTGIGPAGLWHNSRFISISELVLANLKQRLGIEEDCAHCDKPECPNRIEAYVGPANGGNAFRDSIWNGPPRG